jgi:mycothiol synthase
VDLPYRLSSWALDDPDNVGLWVDDAGSLLAWAVMQTPFWTIDYVCHPNIDAHLHGEVLAWADHRARRALSSPSGRPRWFVMAFASQADRMSDLEEAGFASQADVGEDSWAKVLLQRSADMPVADYTLAADFAIRPLAGEDEVKAYVQLHRAVFESKNMSLEWRTRTLRRPEHQPALDLVAVAPDGRLAAFCVCWLGTGTNAGLTGQVEPMGVSPEFRRLGLGRAILSEGLRRVHRCGAGMICVETDKYRDAAMELYETVGFRPTRDILVYRKDYDAGCS